MGKHFPSDLRKLPCCAVKAFHGTVIGLIDTLFEAEHKEISSRKVVTIHVTESLNVSVHIKYPYLIIKGILTIFKEGMLVVEMRPIQSSQWPLILPVPFWWLTQWSLWYPLDDPYEAGSESSSSSELEWKHRQDRHALRSQFEKKKNMIPMNNSLVDLLYCQKQIWQDTKCALQAIQQSQKEHANDSLIDDNPTFDGKPTLYFDWILKLENIPLETKQKLIRIQLWIQWTHPGSYQLGAERYNSST